MRNHRPDTSHLRRVATFRTTPDRSLEQLALHTDVIQVPAGRVVVHAGGAARQFLAVIDGEAEETTRDGRVRRLPPGTEIGAEALAEHKAHETTVVTRTDTTFVVIEGRAFRGATSA